ncbi:hypothetical protein GCM10009112_24950 [Marinomonas arenicola]
MPRKVKTKSYLIKIGQPIYTIFERIISQMKYKTTVKSLKIINSMISQNYAIIFGQEMRLTNLYFNNNKYLISSI